MSDKIFNDGVKRNNHSTNIMGRQKIDMIKNAFRAYYCDLGSAEHLGVIAAYQRSHLYTPGLNNLDIHEYWEAQLKFLAQKYKTLDQTVDVFVKDIIQLKRNMNETFPGRFNNGTTGYDNEFRIAHAQKSLSICLKHLWIRGELGNHVPPVCPVDGVVLKYAHNNDAWTKVNFLNNRMLPNGVMENGYYSHLNILKRQASQDGFECLPEWELVVWWNDKIKREKAKTKEKQNKQAKKSQNIRTKKAPRKDRVSLRVYDGNRTDNYGKTLQIVNNTLTEPHNTNFVYVEYKGVRYLAKEGSYQRGDTLRGARTIQRLIEDNHWRPGQELRCVFENENGVHIYRILEPAE